MRKVKVNHHDGKAYYMMRCPGCDDVHQINDTWTFNGNVEKPTFTPSILVYSRKRAATDAEGNLQWKDGKVGGELMTIDTPRCHSFVRDGKIQFLSDCTHALAGQTVDLPEWDQPSGVDTFEEKTDDR